MKNMFKENKMFLSLGVVWIVLISIIVYINLLSQKNIKPLQVQSPNQVVAIESEYQDFKDNKAFDIFAPGVKTVPNIAGNQKFVLEENMDVYNQAIVNHPHELSEIKEIKQKLILIVALFGVALTALLVGFVIIMDRIVENGTSIEAVLYTTITPVATALIFLLMSTSVKSVSINYSKIERMQSNGTLPDTVLKLDFDETDNAFFYNNMRIKDSAFTFEAQKTDQEVIYRDGELHKK